MSNLTLTTILHESKIRIFEKKESRAGEYSM